MIREARARMCEVAEFENGHTGTLVSIPTIAPRNYRLRKRLSPRSFGPLKVLWWPYQHRGAWVRALLYELPMWSVVLGLGGLFLVPSNATALGAYALTLWAFSLVALIGGLVSMATLAGGVETWGREYDVLTALRSALEDHEAELGCTEPYMYPLTPGPMPG